MLSAPAAPDRSARAWRRVVWFSLSLLGLWLLTQGQAFLTGAEATPPVVVHDEAGTAASDPAALLPPSAYPALFTWGNVAALALLVSGGVLAWMLHQRRTVSGSAPATALIPLGRLPLAPQQELRLVACQDDVLLLGVTQGQISLLQRYPRSAFETAPVGAPAEAPSPTLAAQPADSAAPTSTRPEAPRAQAAAPSGPSPDFASLLFRLQRAQRRSTTPAAPAPASSHAA
ncbi:MAG: flagellar biosynthetic protein FliO [Bacteroidota bacterium]